MTNAPIPEYFSVEQLCEKWRYDKNQLKHAIEKYKISLWICIENTKNIFDMNLSVFEAKINTITSDEIIRINALTDEELRHDGYAISPSPDPDIFCAQKADSKFYIDHSKNGRRIFVSHFPVPEETVHHDGFVELCGESFNDTRKDIANLFEGGELYVVYVKCKKDGYVRFLNPACSITCKDIYIHQTEIKRIEGLLNQTGKYSTNNIAMNAIVNDEGLKMLPYQRQANILKRTDQIIALLEEICIEYPYRIELSKIKQPIQLINLAWVIAICRKGLNSFGDLDFKDIALNSMAETIRKNLIGALSTPTKLMLKLRYIDEVDVVFGVTVTQTMT